MDSNLIPVSSFSRFKFQNIINPKETPRIILHMLIGKKKNLETVTVSRFFFGAATQI